MSQPDEIGLPEALEHAASALPEHADAIRPANGDPFALFDLLDSDAAVEVLRWLLVNEPAAGGELAQEWADSGGETAEPVKSIAPADLPKVARKALKRAHHRLRSRGESVAESQPREIVAKLPKVEDEVEEALVSGIDPRGTHIAYVVEGHPSGGARLFVAVLNEGLGIVELDVFNAGRSKIKQFVRDFTGRRESPAVHAPIAAVRALIARVAAYHPTDRPFPRGFSEWRSHLTAGGEASTPGDLARQDVPESPDTAASLRTVANWVKEGLLGPWPAESSVLQAIAEKLNDASTGVLIVSGTAREQQVEAALEEAVSEVFDAEFSRRTAERFEQTAFFYARLDRAEDAAACLAAASAFREQTPEFRPVAREMLEIILAPVLKNIHEQPEEAGGDEESPLVKP
jgi:hypothetical protein